MITAGACSVAWLWLTYTPQSPAPLPNVLLTRIGPAERTAIQTARDLVIRKPRAGAAWGRLGMVLLAHSFEEAAADCFATAQRFDPTTSSWPYYAGVTLAFSDPERALLQFARAAELRPDDPLPRFRHAELLMDLQRLEQATQILDTVPAAAQPQRLSYDQVRLALLQGQDALKRLRPEQLQALEAGPNRRACLELLAQVWQRLGRSAQVATVTRMLRTDTGDSEGWDDPYIADVMTLRKDPLWQSELARRAFEAGQSEDAVHRMTQLVTDYPDDPQWALQLARMWSQLQRPADAVVILGEAAQRHPKSAEVHFELGNQQFQLQDWSAAAASYAIAIRLKPDYGLAHYNLGQTQLKLSHDAQALKAFRDALRCQPDLAAAHVNLGDILSRTRKPDDMQEARQHLERAVKLDPQDRRAVKLLNQLPKP